MDGKTNQENRHVTLFNEITCKIVQGARGNVRRDNRVGGYGDMDGDMDYSILFCKSRALHSVPAAAAP